MPVHRLQPGEEAPRTGTYALTTEWETTEVALFREKGERLPFITVTAEGPLWYVLIDVPRVNTQAA